MILDEARSEARSIAREAEREHATLLQEARRIRALLSSALATVADATGDDRAAPARPAADTAATAATRAGGLDDTAEHALADAERQGSGFRAA